MFGDVFFDHTLDLGNSSRRKSKENVNSILYLSLIQSPLKNAPARLARLQAQRVHRVRFVREVGEDRLDHQSIVDNAHRAAARGAGLDFDAEYPFEAL